MNKIIKSNALRGALFFLLLSFTLNIVGGCSSAVTYRSEKDFGMRLKTMKKVGVVIPAVEIYELGVGGSLLYDAERSRESRGYFEKSTQKLFASNGYNAILLPTTEDILAVIDYQRQIRSSYSPPPQNITLRSASQSEMEPVLTKYGVDCLAIVEAMDHVSSGGRKTVMTAFAMLGFIGGKGMSYAYLTLVDKTGSSIFYDRKVGSNSNLTDDDDVEDIMRYMVEDIVKAAQ